MKILFDTNVVLDLMLKREPFAPAAAALLVYVETGVLTGFLGATTITTIHYLASKAVGRSQAMAEIRKLLQLFEIAPVNRAVLEGATQRGFDDFEDAVLHEAAIRISAQAIVTRDLPGFAAATIPIYSPPQLLQALQPALEE